MYFMFKSYSLKSIGRKLGFEVKMVDGRIHIHHLHRCPVDRRPLWAQRLSSKSCFCRAVVQSGLLTHRQMVRAALRYRLGRSKDDAVIYWQIDQLGRVHDGKLMWYGSDCHRLKQRNATWVVYLLKRHFNIPQETFQPIHIFFGTHLLKSKTRSQTSDGTTVCVVEAEKSAIILSERYPQYIWLAAGGLHELQPYKFQPLKHYKVILFPDTDPNLTAYTQWYNAAQQVMRTFFWPRHNPIYVSDFLERHASPAQKERKIDLVDYLVEFCHTDNTKKIIFNLLCSPNQHD